jgi:hypothetical protein
MHSASVPIFVKMLGNLSYFLDKAAAFAEARKIDPAVLLGSRLYPDMLPLTRQVQIACDTAKFAMARLTGLEAPKFEDHETTIEQLKERIAKTVDYLKSVPADAFAGSETREVTVPRRDRDPLKFEGEAYLKHYALPNFFFHVTTGYAILRHNGVELGKADFLSGAR